MKKLERLNPKLFVKLSVDEIKVNLCTITGGERYATCESRSVYVPEKKTYRTDWYSDSREGKMGKNGWEWTEPANWQFVESCLSPVVQEPDDITAVIIEAFEPELIS